MLNAFTVPMKIDLEFNGTENVVPTIKRDFLHATLKRVDDRFECLRSMFCFDSVAPHRTQTTGGMWSRGLSEERSSPALRPGPVRNVRGEIT